MKELAALLEPVPLAQFLAAHWEREPLHIRSKDASRFDRVMSSRSLEDLISHGGLRYPAIKLARDGVWYPPEAFTADVQVGMCNFTGTADLFKVSELYATGASITLPALRQSHQPINDLCLRLEHELDYSVHANAYLTPGRSRGFPPHYDCHDVLVLQVGGSKRWLIDAPSIVLPHVTQVFRPEGFTPGPRLMEIDLAAGDLLYLPRGMVHSTLTSGEYSAHLTIGITASTWADCVADAVPGAVDVPELRRALPPGFASNPALRAPLTQKLAQLLAGTPAAGAAARLLDEFTLRVRDSRRRALPFRAELCVISLDTELTAPARERYRLAQRESHLVLTFRDSSYGFPASMSPTLSTMCERTSFRLGELTAALDEQALLSLARHLHGIGFLRPIS